MSILLAAGCTRPAGNNGSGVPFLDGAVKVTASGTRPRSEVTLSRAGALDPASAAMAVMINDASLSLHTRGSAQAEIDAVKLTLDDIDLPPSADLPEGLKLRAVSLELAEPIRATVEQAEADTLVLSANSALTVHSSMVLSDGTLYRLGDTQTAAGDLTVRVTVDGEKATATLDATPPDTCWSVNAAGQELLQAQNCALFVESFATVYSL
jgi:hypothetical protein